MYLTWATPPCCKNHHPCHCSVPPAEPHTFCARAPGHMGPAALGRSSGEASPRGGQSSPGKGCPGKLRILFTWQSLNLSRKTGGWPAFNSAIHLLWVWGWTRELQNFQPAVLWFHHCINFRSHLGEAVMKRNNLLHQDIIFSGNSQLDK